MESIEKLISIESPTRTVSCIVREISCGITITGPFESESVIPAAVAITFV